MVVVFFLAVACTLPQDFDVREIANNHQLSVANHRGISRRHMSYKYITYRGGWLEFLASPRIQKELKLNEQSTKKVADLFKEKYSNRSAYLRQYKWRRGVTPESQLKAAGKFLTELNQSYDKQALECVSEKKRLRMQQLFLWELVWRHGLVGLLLDPHAAKVLDLSDAQKKELLAVTKQFRKTVIQDIKNIPVMIRDEFEKELRRETRQKIEEILGKNEVLLGWGTDNAEVLAYKLAWNMEASAQQKLGVTGEVKCTLRKQFSYVPEISTAQRDDRMELLLKNAYRKQMELTDKQVEKILALYREFAKERNKLNRDFYSIAKSERDKFKQQFFADIKALKERYNDEVESKLLLPHQSERYESVYYQDQLHKLGFYRLLIGKSNGNDFPVKVKLSNSEKEKLKAKRPRVIEKVLRKRDEIQEQFFDKVMAVLTAQQQRMLKKALGEKPSLAPFPDLTSFVMQLDYTIKRHETKRKSGVAVD